MIHKAQAKPKQVVFPEGENEKILRACHALLEEKIALPILVGNAATIQAKEAELELDLTGVRVVDPAESPLREAYIQELFRCGSAGESRSLRRACSSTILIFSVR